jgi:hypothetical protein
MGTIDRYSDDHKLSLSAGKLLTIDAEDIFFTGDIGDTSINGELSVSGEIIANGGITRGADLDIYTTGFTSSITLTSSRDVNIDSSFDIFINASDDFRVDAVDEVDIYAGGVMTLNSDSTIHMHTGFSGVNQTSISLSSFGMKVYGALSSTYIADIVNESTDPGAEGLMVRTLTESPNSSTRYVTFAKGAAKTITGLIRGASTDTSAAFLSAGTSGDTIAYGQTSDLVEVNVTGDCVFVSGSADYGEFIKCGDINEWPVSKQDGNKYIGLPEGYIVYVRNQAFYKEGPGTPMVVTHRSIIIGNERAGDDSAGQVLSFIGQVPVFVIGPVNSGDLIIPTCNFYGKAISPNNIVFSQYIRAIGTAWESSDKDDVKRIMCSIGVKNVY